MVEPSPMSLPIVSRERSALPEGRYHGGRGGVTFTPGCTDSAIARCIQQHRYRCNLRKYLPIYMYTTPEPCSHSLISPGRWCLVHRHLYSTCGPSLRNRSIYHHPLERFKYCDGEKNPGVILPNSLHLNPIIYLVNRVRKHYCR